MHIRLPVGIRRQPSDSSCGATCLHAVYDYFGDPLPLRQVVDEVPELPLGGTLAVTLALHALRRGYKAKLFTYNLQVFDPTWFAPEVDLAAKLRAQRSAKRNAKLRGATDHYLEFLELGGEVRFEELTGALLRRYLKREIPVLTGLSSTYLYRCARELDAGGVDDVAGGPVGHFVVLHGYHADQREVHVADPWHPNPVSPDPNYWVDIGRVLNSILLGIVTYDANLLILEPPPHATKKVRESERKLPVSVKREDPK